MSTDISESPIADASNKPTLAPAGEQTMRTTNKVDGPSWFGRLMDFYWGEFLTQFCYYLPLPLILLLMVGLLSGILFKDFGTVALIRHDHPEKQFWGGFALAIIWIQCLFVGFLLHTASDRPRTIRPPTKEEYPFRIGGPFTKYAIGITFCFVATLGAVILIARLVNVLASFVGKRHEVHDFFGAAFWEGVAIGRPLLLGALSGIAAAIVLSFALRSLLHLVTLVASGRSEEQVSQSCAVLLNDTRAIANVPRMYHGFVFLLVILTVVTYVLVTRAANLAGVLGGAAALLGCAVVVIIGSILFCRKQGAYLILTVRRHACSDRLKHHHYHELAALNFAIIVIWFAALPRVESHSPVTTVCFALFLVLSVYGLLAYVVNRALPLFLFAIVTLVFIAGLPPYKFRFPHLKYQGENALLDLAAEAEKDSKRQEAFDDALKKLLKDKNHQRLTLLESVPSQAVVGTALPAVARQERIELEDRRLGELQDNLTFNRVIPGKDVRRNQPMGCGKCDPRLLLGVDDIPFRAPGEQQKPLVVIVVSGGGIRSAAWTFTVLSKLEKELAENDWKLPPNRELPKGPHFRGRADFASHVRIICGASGGMLGAGYYVATLPPPSERLHPKVNGMRPQRAKQLGECYRRLTTDCLTPIVDRLVYNDLPAFFSPWPVLNDRGSALEEAWRQNLRGSGQDGDPGTSPLDITFAELRNREMAGAYPSLIFSPMLIEDGRRLLVSNLDLRYVASNDGNVLTEDDPITDEVSANLSHEAFELFRMFPDAKQEFQLGTAVRMSASFPFFSPAVPLPTVPRRRVVDAGYYDNYGVSLASSWLFSGKHREWLFKNASGILLIQIRDGLSDEARTLKKIDPETSSSLSRSVEELTSPLEGLNNGRIGSASYRNDGQLELLTAFFRELKKDTALRPEARYFTTVTFELAEEASLSWYLSEEEKGKIARAIEKPEMAARIAKMKTWWRNHVVPE